MPLDLVVPATLPVDAMQLHGVPRHVLAHHVLDRLAPGQRGAVIAIELEEAGTFVNMGMNFHRVAWRAVWRLPGLPELSGSIALWRGEIVS